MDDLTFRTLDQGDLAAYKVLRDGTLQAHPTAFTSDASEVKHLQADTYRSRLGTRPGTFLLGAWQAGLLVGAVGCEREERVKVSHIARVVGMMVDENLQGCGIGRRLMTEAVASARGAAGLEMLTLSVTAQNRIAVGLYLKLGFARYGCLPRAIRVAGNYYDKELMMLDLRPTSTRA